MKVKSIVVLLGLSASSGALADPLQPNSPAPLAGLGAMGFVARKSR